jgi:hypothetical protein
VIARAGQLPWLQLLGISRLHGQEFDAEVAEPVEAAALLAARRPRSALGWLRTAGGGQIPGSTARLSGPIPLTEVPQTMGHAVYRVGCIGGGAWTPVSDATKRYRPLV